MTVHGTGQDSAVDVTCTVTNVGGREGREVVQLYVSDPASAVYRPPQELKAFSKVHLEAGARATVRLRLDARDLAYWSPTHHRWVVEGGEVEIRVGASARDIRLRATVEVAGEDLGTSLHPESLTSEWLEHPVAGAWLIAALADREDRSGLGSGLLGDGGDELIRAIPLRRLCRFPGFPIREEELTDWAERARQGVDAASGGRVDL